jgi:hypothetical protein
VKLDDIPKEFRGFDLYRYRRATTFVAPEVKPTEAECAESCWSNMQTAAAEMAQAQAIYDAKPQGDPLLQFALGEVNRLRAERDHWRGMMAWFRERAPATAATATMEDPRLPREREVGADDGEGVAA